LVYEGEVRAKTVFLNIAHLEKTEFLAKEVVNFEQKEGKDCFFCGTL
jgi:hypothetical protein